MIVAAMFHAPTKHRVGYLARPTGRNGQNRLVTFELSRARTFDTHEEAMAAGAIEGFICRSVERLSPRERRQGTL